MRVAIYHSQTATQNRLNVLDAVRSGLSAIGVDSSMVLYGEDVSHFDVMVCWGYRAASNHINSGKNVLIIENGYIGDRTENISLGWNGLNNYADFINDDVPGDRYEKNIAHLVKPWRDGGDYALLCGQVVGDQSLRGRDVHSMYPYFIRRLMRDYKLPVVWRPHPEAVRKGYKYEVRGMQPSLRTLEEDMAGAAVVCAYNSNALTDAVVNGIPAIAIDKGAMAWDMCAHDFTDIVRPDRSEWLRKMAYTQWKLQEIASGEAMKHIWRKYV